MYASNKMGVAQRLLESDNTSLTMGLCPAGSLLAVNALDEIVGLVPSLAGDFGHWTGTEWSLSCGAKDYRATNVVEASITNSTAATSGVPIQHSGVLELAGTGHDTDGDVSVLERWGLQVRPVNGNTVSSALHLLRGTGAGAFNSKFNFSSAGTFTAAYSIIIGQSAGFLAVGTAGKQLYFEEGYSSSMGLGTVSGVINTSDNPGCWVNTVRADTANLVWQYIVGSSSTGLFSNMATMRALSVGVAKTASTATEYERFAVMVDGATRQSPQLLNASGVPIVNAGAYSRNPVSEITALAEAATTDTTMEIPAGAVLYGLSVFVRTKPADSTNIDVGIDGDATRFAENLSLVVGTKLELALEPVRYPTATKIRFTPDVTPGDSTGRLAVQLYYDTVTAAGA